MIDTTKEKPVPLKAARELDVFPSPPSFGTMFRWCMHGIQGVKLEWIRSGGTMCTSVAAIQRFQERLSGVPAGKRTPSEATVARAAADKYLDAHGL